MMTTYSIVIPVYKSDESLKKLAFQFEQFQNNQRVTLQVIFVNDSPTYLPTRNALAEIAANYPFATVITLRKNQGQHIALLVGLSYAKGKFVITMDDDLQHPVAEIPKLISAMEQNREIDAIFALPSYKRKKHALWRNWASQTLNKVDTFFQPKPKGLMKSAFRIMTNDLANIITKNYNALPSISSLIVSQSHNLMNIEVDHEERQHGKSNYSIPKMIHLALNNLIHYSSLPLKILGFIGAIGFIFSLIFILFIFFRKVCFGISFPGYASTVTLISFFGGLNLLAVGIIGEYLIRIIKEQQKPDLSLLIRDQNLPSSFIKVDEKQSSNIENNT